MKFENPEDTICALSTPQGIGAISLIRLSGKDSITIIDSVFSKSILNVESHTAHFGTIKNGDMILDEVLVTVFKNPNSFTGENLIEIGCHGSPFIQAQILKLVIGKGARLAGPGEFSMRAFFNGKMDLSQTEAIADLIASGSERAHKLAIHQMR
ncbi:MAG: tRNA modification GTPase, partial [Arenicella sp.]